MNIPKGSKLSTATIKMGNLIKAFESNEVDVILHCCNTQPGNMGGFAGVLAKSFPAVLESDKRTHDTFEKLGTNDWVDINSDQVVVNMYTQLIGSGYDTSPRQLTYYSAIYKCLSEALHTIDEAALGRTVNVGMPAIASCRGGAEWFQVWDMINCIAEELGNVNVVVYVLPDDSSCIDLVLPRGSVYYDVTDDEFYHRRHNILISDSDEEVFQLWIPQVNKHNQPSAI